VRAPINFHNFPIVNAEKSLTFFELLKVGLEGTGRFEKTVVVLIIATVKF
jgi:hypothetical protein